MEKYEKVKAFVNPNLWYDIKYRLFIVYDVIVKKRSITFEAYGWQLLCGSRNRGFKWWLMVFQNVS